MKLADMKKCHINFRKYEKMQKMFPEGIVVDGVDLLQIIATQNHLMHQFRNEGNINPKDTSVRSTQIWQMIRECFE